MKLTVERNLFVEALKKVSRGVGTSNTLEVLKGFKLKAIGNTLKIGVSNLVFSIETRIACEIFEEGELVLSSDFFDLAKKLPNEKFIEIQTEENNKVRISCGKAKLLASYMDGDLFPKTPSIENGESIVFDGHSFVDTIQKVAISLSLSDNSRPSLGGVFFNSKDNFMEIVTSDGYRLTLVTREVKTDDFSLLIAGTALLEASRILSGDNIKIVFSEEQCCISDEDTEVFARLLDNKSFPRHYNQLIPKEFGTKLKINVKDFIGALERVKATMKSEDVPLVKLIINNGSLLLEGNAKASLSLFEEALAVDQTGDNLEIGFNVNFLLDGLKTVDEDETFIGLTGAISPAVIKAEGFTYLVLPIRMID